MTPQQASALRTLADKLKPHHLVRCGVTTRKSEAEHFIEMLKQASTPPAHHSASSGES